MDDFLGIVVLLIALGFISFLGYTGLTFVSSKSETEIVETCEKTGTFFVGNKVFDCKVRTSK